METELIQGVTDFVETVQSITPEQFQELLDSLEVINNNIVTVSNYIIFAIVLFTVYFVVKLLYGLFGHVFFGGI